MCLTKNSKKLAFLGGSGFADFGRLSIIKILCYDMIQNNNVLCDFGIQKLSKNPWVKIKSFKFYINAKVRNKK